MEEDYLISVSMVQQCIVSVKFTYINSGIQLSSVLTLNTLTKIQKYFDYFLVIIEHKHFLYSYRVNTVRTNNSVLIKTDRKRNLYCSALQLVTVSGHYLQDNILKKLTRFLRISTAIKHWKVLLTKREINL